MHINWVKRQSGRIRGGGIHINAVDDSFQEFFRRDQNETYTYDRITHFKKLAN